MSASRSSSAGRNVIPNDDRLFRLVHYVCKKAPPGKLGSVKLNKILWFIDKTAFRAWGRSVSGQDAYIKRRFGPVPRDIVATLERLVGEKLIEHKQKIVYGYPQNQFFSLQEPDISMFNEKEIGLADYITDEICNNHTADSIIELSHDLAWRSAPMGGEIPLIATLAEETAEITKEDLRWARAATENKGSL